MKSPGISMSEPGTGRRTPRAALARVPDAEIREGALAWLQAADILD